MAVENPAAAIKVAAAVRRTGNGLADMPSGRPGRVAGIYEKVVRSTPYIIAYAIEPLAEGGEAVVILRVIHGARDWREGEWPQ